MFKSFMCIYAGGAVRLFSKNTFRKRHPEFVNIKTSDVENIIMVLLLQPILK